MPLSTNKTSFKLLICFTYVISWQIPATKQLTLGLSAKGVEKEQKNYGTDSSSIFPNIIFLMMLQTNIDIGSSKTIKKTYIFGETTFINKK